MVKFLRFANILIIIHIHAQKLYTLWSLIHHSNTYYEVLLITTCIQNMLNLFKILMYIFCMLYNLRIVFCIITMQSLFYNSSDVSLWQSLQVPLCMTASKLKTYTLTIFTMQMKYELYKLFFQLKNYLVNAKICK